MEQDANPYSPPTNDAAQEPSKTKAKQHRGPLLYFALKRAAVGLIWGLIAPPACGAVIGLLFGMVTMDTPAPPGLAGMAWGATLFAIVFSVPGACFCAIVGAIDAASVWFGSGRWRLAAHALGISCLAFVVSAAASGFGRSWSSDPALLLFVTSVGYLIVGVPLSLADNR